MPADARHPVQAHEIDDAPAEFHYRWPQQGRGMRPGAHAGRELGAGHLPAGHRRLLEHPDPRRLDVRASLRDDPRGDWLVRVARQPTVVPLMALVDVSPSMHFGAPRSKLDLARAFVHAMAWSAFRHGDPAGLILFDAHGANRPHAPRHGRGVAQALRDSVAPRGKLDRLRSRPDAAQGLRAAAEHLDGKAALVFLVSDFHGIARPAIEACLERLAHCTVVPLLAWDRAETEPPLEHGLLNVADAETTAHSSIWINARTQAAWRDAVRQRRAELDAAFAHRALPVFDVCRTGQFEAEALTRHFLEGGA